MGNGGHADIEHAVLIVGAGPTGLMLAGELALSGTDVAIIERRTDQAVTGSRAGGLHARTIEVFDQRGIADRFLAEGQKAQVAGFAGTTFDIGDFPTRHPYGLALWQTHIERILAGWAAERGVPVYRNATVTTLTQTDAAVELVLADGRSARALYVVGCDGGRSVIRKAAGIEFPGTEATTSNLIAEAQLAVEPTEWGIHRDAVGIHALSRRENGGHIGILVTERQAAHSSEPTLGELSEAMTAVYGTDFGVHTVISLSRFTDATRQAATYRKGRVLVAGDAAHIHPPDGGQGLQTGVQDAVNLGWKLAQVIRGQSPDSLLDTYHAERHPVAARVLRNARASIVLRRADEHVGALRHMLSDILAMDEPRRQLGAMMSGLDIRYDFGAGHPLLGRRMPDLDLRTKEGPARLFSLLREAKPLLLSFDSTVADDAAPWRDRVRTVAATTTAAWELPVIRPVAAPSAVLVRPDGYVAWVGTGSTEGLVAALTQWFGPAAM